MMLASGTADELLGLDDAETWADLAAHPAWVAVTSGLAPPETVRALVLTLYPVFTGRARYMLAGKVTRMAPDDGKEIFAGLHRALTVPDADADAGWAAVAEAVGLTGGELEAAAASPPAEASDLVTVAREHGMRSAHEGVGVAWVLDRRIPVLLGQFADALAGHYGVPEDALRHLRFRAAQAGADADRVTRLAGRYLQDPWQVYEARRAAREMIWDLTALLEAVAA
jgi:pyrroloquinoline quinone (PQQ) biosynthesis protein C